MSCISIFSAKYFLYFLNENIKRTQHVKSIMCSSYLKRFQGMPRLLRAAVYELVTLLSLSPILVKTRMWLLPMKTRARLLSMEE